jgi:PTS system mannose-specific IIA component
MHVVGKQARIVSVPIHFEEDRKDVQAKITEAVEQAGGENAVIVTDMFGGSPSNLSLEASNKFQCPIVYGASLPLLVKLAKSRHKPRDEAVSAAIDAGRRYTDAMQFERSSGRDYWLQQSEKVMELRGVATTTSMELANALGRTVTEALSQSTSNQIPEEWEVAGDLELGFRNLIISIEAASLQPAEIDRVRGDLLALYQLLSQLVREIGDKTPTAKSPFREAFLKSAGSQLGKNASNGLYFAIVGAVGVLFGSEIAEAVYDKVEQLLRGMD